MPALRRSLPGASAHLRHVAEVAADQRPHTLDNRFGRADRLQQRGGKMAGRVAVRSTGDTHERVCFTARSRQVRPGQPAPSTCEYRAAPAERPRRGGLRRDLLRSSASGLRALLAVERARGGGGDDDRRHDPEVAVVVRHSRADEHIGSVLDERGGDVLPRPRGDVEADRRCAERGRSRRPFGRAGSGPVYTMRERQVGPDKQAADLAEHYKGRQLEPPYDGRTPA